MPTRLRGGACAVSNPVIREGGGQREYAQHNLPRTIMKATRYGRGKVRLKESSSGSTAGSPSISTRVDGD